MASVERGKRACGTWISLCGGTVHAKGGKGRHAGRMSPLPTSEGMPEGGGWRKGEQGPKTEKVLTPAHLCSNIFSARLRSAQIFHMTH